MNSKLNNIKKLISDKPSSWEEKANERISKPWLREYSSQIARRIVSIIYNKNQETTQVEFAKLLRVSRQQVGKIISGQENMTLESIWKLSKALNFELITFPEYKYSTKTSITIESKAGQDVHYSPPKDEHKKDDEIVTKTSTEVIKVIEVSPLKVVPITVAA